MVRVGLTGGIGSGKTTVARVFEALGVAVYQADLRAKELMSSNREIIAELTGLLGPEAYIDGQLNRAWIATRIFDNKDLLTRMNAIVHPRVAADWEEWAANYAAREHMFRKACKAGRATYSDDNEMIAPPIVIMEAAILFESGFERLVDRVVTVEAPVEQRMARAAARDGVTPESIRLRMANQMSDEERTARADFVIDNSDDCEVLPQILKVYDFFTHET